MRLLGLAGLCVFACASRVEDPVPRLPARDLAPESLQRACPERVVLPSEDERFALEPIPQLSRVQPFAFEFAEPRHGALVDPLALERTSVALSGLEHLKEDAPHKLLVGVDGHRRRPLSSGKTLSLAELVPFGLPLSRGWHQLNAVLVSERGDFLPFAGRSREDSVLVRRFWVGAGQADGAPPSSLLIYNSPTGTYHLAATGTQDVALEPFLDFASIGLPADGSGRVLVEIQNDQVRYAALADGDGSYRLPQLASGDYRITLTQGLVKDADASCAHNAPPGPAIEVVARVSQVITINREQAPRAGP